MPCYSAYGIRVCSDLKIPWFLEEQLPDKGRVFVRHLPSLPRGTLKTSVGTHAVGRSVLQYEGSCQLEVLDGTEIRISGEAGVSDEELATLVAGVGMGVLQHQLGRLVLHASAVRGPAGVVAFLGGSGWGKSTAAAAFYFQGWSFITDDIAAFVRDQRGHLVLTPSFPAMKLWPDALRAVGRDPGDYPAIFPGNEKRRVGIDAGFEVGPKKLVALYVLGEGPSIEVADIGLQEAFAELVRHSFAVRALEDAGPQPWHVELVAELVRDTRIRRLLAPPDAAVDTDDIARTVRADVVKIAAV